MGINGLRKSYDGGRSWQEINDGLPKSQIFDCLCINSLSIDYQDSSTLYLGLMTVDDSSSGSNPIKYYSRGVYKSNNGGRSWFSINNNLPVNALYGFFPRKPQIAPSDPNTLFLQATVDTTYNLYKSINKGLTWSPIAVPPDEHGQWSREFQIDPSNASHLYATNNDGKLFESMDGGGSWVQSDKFGVPVGRVSKVLTTSSGKYLYLYGENGLFRITLSEIEFLDPACSAPTNCNGEYLQVTSNSDVKLINELPKLVTADVSRSGVGADGVTKLLVRLPIAVPVTFSIKDPNGNTPSTGAFGSLTNRSGEQRGNTIKITPDDISPNLGKYAFAVYEAPIDNPNGNLPTEITIEATFSLSIGQPQLLESKKLVISPPPIILTHGLWSNPGIWSGLARELKGLGHVVIGVNYKETAADSFADVRSLGALVRATNEALNSIRRSKNVAATQVDAIGHSMGGLLIRKRTMLGKEAFSPYKRPDNYFKGDFHKIISIGTPHRGSQVANYLAEHKCDPVFWKFTLAGVYAFRNTAIEGGIFSLQTDSDEIRSLGRTDVPSHAIVGIAPNDTDTESSLNSAFSWLLSDKLTTIDGLLGGNGNHDLLVTKPSQTGGVSNSAMYEVPGVIHGSSGEWIENAFVTSLDDIGEYKSPTVWNRIIALLGTSVTAAAFNRFDTHDPLTFGLRNYNCTPPAQTQVLSPSSSSVTVTLTPLPGLIVKPGEIIQAKFTVTGGEAVQGAVLLVGKAIYDAQGPGPFSFSVKIPEQRAGRLDISAFTLGSRSATYTANTYVTVLPASLPVSISVSPESASFNRIGQSLLLHVVGQMSDGKEIDLTSSASGTTYSNQSGGDTVVSLSPEGVIVARGSGTENVVVKNSGKTSAVSIEVPVMNPAPIITSLTPSYIQAGSTGFTLTISGSNFLPISTVYWDNAPRPAKYISPTQLRMEVTSANVAAPGTHSITIFNNLPGGGTVSADFTVSNGIPLPSNSMNSDQKAGAVLVYNLFTSNSASLQAEDTRIGITNTNSERIAYIHLFFVDGANCSVADAFVTLTPNQTISFLASDLDPDTFGYLIAVAVDGQTGCPVNFNFLIGDEYVKLRSGHAANLSAEAFSALFTGSLCNTTPTTAVLNFDGISYNQVPRALTLVNLASRATGNDTLLVINRVGGNFAAGASTIGGLQGTLYDDLENTYSFTISVGGCQLRSSLTSTLLRTTSRLENVIPAGHSGWLKIWGDSEIGLLGAALNLNHNAKVSAEAYNQGHNLHNLTFTNAVSLTIPTIPPR